MATGAVRARSATVDRRAGHRLRYKPMMPLAIDQSERRRPAAVARTRVPARRGGRGRSILIGALVCLSLVALSAAAHVLMAGLAGPQFVRPTLAQAQASQSAPPARAADWPDLKDGLPVLAPDPGRAKPAPAHDPVAAIVPEPTASPRNATAPSLPATSPPVRTAAARPFPSIEPAALVPPPSPVVVLAAARTASVIAPTATQTLRARTTTGTFAALPPEPRRKVATLPPKAKAATRPVAEASAEPAAPVAEHEPERSEVFGAAGRKIVEGVEAIGNAVKNLPNQF